MSRLNDIMHKTLNLCIIFLYSHVHEQTRGPALHVDNEAHVDDQVHQNQIQPRKQEHVETSHRVVRQWMQHLHIVYYLFIDCLVY